MFENVYRQVIEMSAEMNINYILNVNLTLTSAGKSIMKMSGIRSRVLVTQQSGQNKEMSCISCNGNSRSVTSVSTLNFINTNFMYIYIYKLIKVNSHHKQGTKIRTYKSSVNI